jgi:hypothetical protein
MTRLRARTPRKGRRAMASLPRLIIGVKHPPASLALTAKPSRSSIAHVMRQRPVSREVPARQNDIRRIGESLG